MRVYVYMSECSYVSDDTTNIHPGQGPISCIGP
jgi:hypothetical protein